MCHLTIVAVPLRLDKHVSFHFPCFASDFEPERHTIIIDMKSKLALYQPNDIESHKQMDIYNPKVVSFLYYGISLRIYIGFISFSLLMVNVRIGKKGEGENEQIHSMVFLMKIIPYKQYYIFCRTLLLCCILTFASHNRVMITNLQWKKL